jgi:hypothetical protein
VDKELLEVHKMMEKREEDAVDELTPQNFDAIKSLSNGEK